MSEAEVLEKIHKLPDPVQQHLFLYVDFLFEAYSQAAEENGSQFFEQFELSDAGKSFLNRRLEQAKAHPEKQVPWREALEKVNKKHGLTM